MGELRDEIIKNKQKRNRMLSIAIPFIAVKIAIWFYVIGTIWTEPSIGPHFKFVVAIVSIGVVKTITTKPLDDWIKKKIKEVKEE